MGIFKTLLNRWTFIEAHKLLKSGRSGEQYPFLFTLVDERLNFVRRSAEAALDNSPHSTAQILTRNQSQQREQEEEKDKEKYLGY